LIPLLGGELAEISRLEKTKQERVRFQLLDDDEGDADDDEAIEIVDELSELERFDEDDEDEF
jgi:hypothetical protein